MSPKTDRRYTVEEYLAQERSSQARHEYFQGEIFAMTGASRAHNLIVANLVAHLHPQIRNRDCELYANDMRVRIPETGLYTYPDLVVVCGEPRFEDAELDTLENPTLIVEVLSRTTEDYDRGTKFAHYRTLPSLSEYLVLAQDRVHAEHAVRQQEERWLLSETGDPTATLTLGATGCLLVLSAAYEKVPLEAAP